METVSVFYTAKTRVYSKLILSLFTLLFTACNDHMLFHQYVPIASEGWTRTDTILFTLPPAPAEEDCQLYLGLRYGNTFPYEGIWIVVETELQHPSSVHSDTIYFTTTEKSKQGILFNQQEKLVRTLHLHPSQQGTIRLHHVMNRETMPAITDIGIKIRL